MNKNTILEVKNLSLKFARKKILDNLSIQFWQGHVHAVVGPNGAGKSTLASTIMGLSGYNDYEGDIFYDGQSIKNLSVDARAKKGLTMAWQEPARFEGLLVRNFIAAGRENISEPQLQKVLELVGLDPSSYLNRAVDKTLSGGERKRIELASIMAMEPKLVIMDEPDSGIDVEALNRIFNAIQILKDNGTTVILITHSQAVLKQAEHAFLICHGKIVGKGIIDKIEGFFSDKCLPCDHQNMPVEGELNGQL